MAGHGQEKSSMKFWNLGDWENVGQVENTDPPYGLPKGGLPNDHSKG